MSKNYNKLFNNKNKESEKVEPKETVVPKVAKEPEVTIGVDLANEPDVTVISPSQPMYKTMIVQVKHLNVRSEPYKKAPKVAILKRDQKVTVTYQDGEWSEIEFTHKRKTKAYVMTKHIS